MNWDAIEERDRRRDADARRLKEDQRKQFEEVKARRRQDLNGRDYDIVGQQPTSTSPIQDAKLSPTRAPVSTTTTSGSSTSPFRQAMTLVTSPLASSIIALPQLTPPPSSHSPPPTFAADRIDTDLLLTRLAHLEQALDRERQRRANLEEHLLATRRRMDEALATLSAGQGQIQLDLGSLAAQQVQLRTAVVGGGTGGGSGGHRDTLVAFQTQAALVANEMEAIKAAVGRVEEHVQVVCARTESRMREAVKAAIADAEARVALAVDRAVGDVDARHAARTRDAVLGVEESVASALAAVRSEWAGAVDAALVPMRDTLAHVSREVAGLPASLREARDLGLHAEAQVKRLEGVTRAEIQARAAADAGLAQDIDRERDAVRALVQGLQVQVQASEAQVGDRIADTRASLSGAISKVQGQVERMGQGLAVAVSDLDGRCRRVEAGLVKVQDRVAGLDLAWNGLARRGDGKEDEEKVGFVDPVLAELDRTRASGSVPLKIGSGQASQVDVQGLGDGRGQLQNNRTVPMTSGKQREPFPVAAGGPTGTTTATATQRMPPAAGPQESIPIGPTIVQELLERVIAKPEPVAASAEQKPEPQPSAATEPVAASVQPKPSPKPEPVAAPIEPKPAPKPSVVAEPANKLEARQKSEPRLKQEKQPPVSGADSDGTWKSGEDGKLLPVEPDAAKVPTTEKPEPRKVADGRGV